MGESYERRRLQVPEPRVPGRGGRALFTAVVAVLDLVHSLLSRMRVTGGPLPAGGVVVVLNHRSTADGTLAAVVGRRLGRQLRLMGTAGIFTVPVLGRVLLAVGIIPVKRRSEQARGSLDGAVGMLAAGEAVGVFPEGVISHRADGLPAELKTGAARLALTAGVPVVALGLWGADLLIPPGKPRVSLRRPVVRASASAPLDLCAAVGVAGAGVAGGEPTHEQVRAATALLHELLTAQVGATSRRLPRQG